MVNKCKPLCGQRGDDVYVTSDREKVDCKKCEMKLILEPDIVSIEDRKPICYFTGRMADTGVLANVVSQKLVENNMVEEAYTMMQMVGRCEFFEDVIMIFEQFVELK